MTERGNPWREVGLYSGIGLAFAVFVFGGFFLGRWLDGFFGSTPWLAMSGAFLGFVAAVVELLMMLRRG